MDASVVVAIVVIAIVLIVAAVLYARQRKRSEQLQERFGPEYDRSVAEAGGRRGAESDLIEREKRRESLDIRSLDPERQEQFATSWRDTQSRFVDEPSQAVGDADRLVQDVMRERGYPVDDFDQRSADVSVDHPEVVSDYRAAHAISLANDHGEASTEDLRQAMIHYRSLFDALLEQN
jgi:hypothetical protein